MRNESIIARMLVKVVLANTVDMIHVLLGAQSNFARTESDIWTLLLQRSYDDFKLSASETLPLYPERSYRCQWVYSRDRSKWRYPNGVYEILPNECTSSKYCD